MGVDVSFIGTIPHTPALNTGQNKMSSHCVLRPIPANLNAFPFGPLPIPHPALSNLIVRSRPVWTCHCLERTSNHYIAPSSLADHLLWVSSSVPITSKALQCLLLLLSTRLCVGKIIRWTMVSSSQIYGYDFMLMIMI